MAFYILPKDPKNSVAKDIQVLNSERIIGYNTYTSMINGDSASMSGKDGLQDKSFLQMNDDADYYNVTVNLIVKKGGNGNIEGQQIQPSQPSQPSQVSQLSPPTQLSNLPIQVQNIIKEVQLEPQFDLIPKDVAKVELATDTSASSSYEAAAALDLSSSESKKEIAESENYVSRLAKQQASTILQSGGQAPPSDMNA